MISSPGGLILLRAVGQCRRSLQRCAPAQVVSCFSVSPLTACCSFAPDVTAVTLTLKILYQKCVWYSTRLMGVSINMAQLSLNGRNMSVHRGEDASLDTERCDYEKKVCSVHLMPQQAPAHSNENVTPQKATFTHRLAAWMISKNHFYISQLFSDVRFPRCKWDP